MSNFDPSQFFGPGGFVFPQQQGQQQQQQQQQQGQVPQQQPQQMNQNALQNMQHMQQLMGQMSNSATANNPGTANNANAINAAFGQLPPGFSNFSPQQLQTFMQWRFNPGTAPGAPSGLTPQQQMQLGAQVQELQRNAQQQQQQQQQQQGQQQPQQQGQPQHMQNAAANAFIQQQQQQQTQQRQPNAMPNNQNAAFPSAAISGAQAASAASQAAAMNRMQLQMQQQQQPQQQPPQPQQQQQQPQNQAASAPGPSSAMGAPGANNFPNGIPAPFRELASRITDTQLDQWVEKAKQGKFSASQRQQLQMILQLRHQQAEQQKQGPQPNAVQQGQPNLARPPSQPQAQQPQQQQPVQQNHQPQQSQPTNQQAGQQQQRLMWANANQMMPGGVQGQQQGSAGISAPNTQQNLQAYNMAGGNPGGANPQQQQQQQHAQQAGPQTNQQAPTAGPSSNQGGMPPAGNASMSTNGAMMFKMAQQDPRKVFQAFTMKMKDLEAKMNNPQSTVQERQTWGQQFHEIKNTLSEIAQRLSASGQFQPGKSGTDGSAGQQQQQQQQQHQAQQARPPSAQAGPSNAFPPRPNNPQAFAQTPVRPAQPMNGQLPTASPAHPQFSSPVQPTSSMEQQQQQPQQQPQSTPRLAGGVVPSVFQQSPAMRPPPPQQPQQQQPQGPAQPQWQGPPGVQQQQPQAIPRPSQLPANSPLSLKQEQFQRALADILPRHGITLNQPVLVGGQQIDLWTLYQAVADRGGMAAVSQGSAWPAVVVAIGLAQHGSPEAYTLASPLAETYQSYLLAFEGVWQRAVQSLMAQQRAKQQAQQSQATAAVPQGSPALQGMQAGQGFAQQQQSPQMQQMPGAMQQQRPMMPPSTPQQQQLQQLQQQQAAAQMRMAQQQQQQQQMSPAQRPNGFQPQGMQPPAQRPPQPQPQQAGGGMAQPVPHVSEEQLAQFGISREKFAELWKSGALGRNAANNQQRPPQQQQQQQQPQQVPGGMQQQGQASGAVAPQPFAPAQSQSAIPQLPQSQPPPQGEGRQMPITREKFEDAKEQLRKVDEELVSRRPELKAPRAFSEEERLSMTAFVKDLCEVCDHCNVLLPAFFALNGAPLETSGAKRAKIMLWMMRDQVAAMRRGESTMSMEDLKKMAMHFQRIITFVKTSNINVYEHLLKEYRDARAKGAPSFILGQTYADGDVKQRQYQQQAAQQQQPQQQQQAVPQPDQLQQYPSQAGSSAAPQDASARPPPPQVNPAGALPVDEATAAQMGIKRGLRVDDLKLPPSKRGKVAGTPGTPTNNSSVNNASSPLAAAEASPAPGKGESPRLGAASPPSVRGGKRAQTQAQAQAQAQVQASSSSSRGRAKKGKTAATPTSGGAKGEETSPKAKAKTSADIMAEVKAEIAAEEGRKRKAEADKAAAGIEDPSKNPILIADAQYLSEQERLKKLSDSDPVGFLEQGWQSLLTSSGGDNGAGQSAFTGLGGNPLRALLESAGMSPSMMPSNEPAEAEVDVAATELDNKGEKEDASNDADNFFDFDLFDTADNGGEGDKDEGGVGDDGQPAAGGAEGDGTTAAARDQNVVEVDEETGLPYIPFSDDGPGETPELISSSGAPSAASSSTSSTRLLSKMTGNLSRRRFDENGYWIPPRSTSPEENGDTPEDPEHPTPSGVTQAATLAKTSNQEESDKARYDDDDLAWWNADHQALYGDMPNPWLIVKPADEAGAH